MNFQIGQKVVCVDKSPIKIRFSSRGDEGNNLPLGLILGAIYSVHDILYCSKCGTQNIHVGLFAEYFPGIYTWCDKCSNIIDDTEDTREWLESWRFVPLEEYEASEKMVEELVQETTQQSQLTKPA